MKTEFELLIEELELERAGLEEELQECLREKDYKYAQYFQKGIWRLDRKIKTLSALNRNPTIPDTQYLVDAIIELKENFIERFSVFFMANTDFYLHFFRLQGGQLFCQIPSEKEMSTAYYYRYFSKDYNRISSLGYVLDTEFPGTVFDVETDNSCKLILTKLSILMFDILAIRTDAKGYIVKK